MSNYTETTTEGWFSRIGNALKGIVFGLILVFSAFALLIWNEGRAVDRIKTLEEGSGAVISIDAGSVLPENNLKLVHLHAKVDTKERLADPVFKFHTNAIKLKRYVETYQWEEEVTTKTEKQLGGGETTTKEYRYEKVWSPYLINSNEFKDSSHQNPTSLVFDELVVQATDIRFGAFKFSEHQLEQLTNYREINLDPNAIDELQSIKNIKPFNGGYYIGADPTTPKIGDIRVHFEIIEPQEVSIVAQQISQTFQPFQTKNGEISLLEYGIVSQEQMFQNALDSNSFWTWVLRIVGVFLMSAGISMILQPLVVFADVLPILGDIVGAGTGIIAFLLAVVLSVLTIALAWLFFRPLIGIALLVVSFAAVFAIKSKIKSTDKKTLEQ